MNRKALIVIIVLGIIPIWGGLWVMYGMSQNLILAEQQIEELKSTLSSPLSQEKQCLTELEKIQESMIKNHKELSNQIEQTVSEHLTNVDTRVKTQLQKYESSISEQVQKNELVLTYVAKELERMSQ